MAFLGKVFSGFNLGPFPLLALVVLITFFVFTLYFVIKYRASVPKFFATMFSASDQVSSGRFYSLVALLFACGWDTYLVIVNHTLSGIPLLDEAIFVTLMYGITKTGDVISKYFEVRPNWKP